MLGFLFGYLLGSPYMVVKGYQARPKPGLPDKAWRRAQDARRKHDLTCPNLPKQETVRHESDYLFY